MASSGLQLLGFSLALVGLAATVAATMMVEWKKQYQGKTHRIYEGLFMSCSGNERTTCESHMYLLKLPSKFYSHICISSGSQTLPVEIFSSRNKLL